jgi:hypothetical protein
MAYEDEYYPALYQQQQRPDPRRLNELAYLQQQPQDEEVQFRQWIKALPWYSEFVSQYGEEPNLDDPNYDYRTAWKAGIEPQRYEHDHGRYHWPSQVPETGQMLKGPDHPTKWMNDFMQQNGVDPNVYMQPGYVPNLPSAPSNDELQRLYQLMKGN